MSKPVVVFDVLECNGNTAVVCTSSCTFRVNHGTDIEFVPIEVTSWSQKNECAVIHNDGYDVEVDTIVNQNAELFITSDVFNCDSDDSDIVAKIYLSEQIVKYIASAIEKHIQDVELEKIEKSKEV